MCVEGYLVDHTHVVNASTIDFYMKDGKVLRSNLSTPCRGLNFHGFKVIGREGEICAPGGISVLVSNEVCELGRFQPVENRTKTSM
jgi:formylmethanofuran dehydrogenase subunit A